MTDTPERIMPYDPEYEHWIVGMKHKLQTYDALKQEHAELLEALEILIPIAEWASAEQSPPGAYDPEIDKARAILEKVSR